MTDYVLPPINYSHSIAPVEKIEWWTGISPLIIRCGSGVELVLKEIFGIREDVQNILIKYTQCCFCIEVVNLEYQRIYNIEI